MPDLSEPELPEQELSQAQVLDYLKSRRGLIDGVCICGGEPLAQEGILEFVRTVKEMGFSVKIDTNGSRPELLRLLVESGGIDYVAMDIKNTPEKYEVTIGIPGYDAAPIKESAAFLLTGRVEYEFRTTVVRELHTIDDLLCIANWLKGADKYYLQTFENPEKALKPALTPYSKAEMKELARRVKEALPCVCLREQ